MTPKLVPYTSPATVRSTLFKVRHDSVPPTEELDQLHAELKSLKQRTLERAKKAGEDLRTIEDSMRRMRDKEKGKAKDIKLERDYTPIPDAEETKPAGLSHSSHIKSRFSSIPLASNPPSSSRSSMDPRKSLAEDLKKKKKKRKREHEDSDIEMGDIPRSRKTSLPPTVVQPPPPPKLSKSSTSTSHTHNKPLAGPDFSLPPTYPLLPTRPQVQPHPLPGPSKPTEVMEDFSKSKQPSQVLVTTFYTSIEPWIRNIKEEDIGFLEYAGDEVEPYIMPKLGRHYTEVWEEEDMATYGSSLPGFGATQISSSASAPFPKWDPSTLTEPDLVTEERGHGPLTERLISALLPMPDMTVWKGVKAAEDAMEGRPGGGSGAASRREKMNVSDLEERIRDTMRFHRLLDSSLKEQPDYSSKVDDPIATALRHAQHELRSVASINKARKERLAAIARDRLGYQEYLDLRDSIDKNISTLYTKLQKKDVPKTGKKKKKGLDVNGNTGGTSVNMPLPSPAALGLNPDDENRLVVSDQLKQLVETRRQWVDAVGGVFEQKEAENPGRIIGFPKTSVYEGLEDPGREMEQAESSSPGPTKGKRRAKGDEMDIG